ncbi:FAS1-like dehydratase domain-containing protein [Amycolatopsis cihanbeyliensis]|uniref:MaoC dehydratase-like protein n=1 Tax=Amycolatopsis cihanbeyliensis TaxID=1128664 RepID=A0A542DRD8_AMYCI|nr:MaoC family dehydratase N-terminal domain-containing protein [Amycolatopsis cihanbeyliensis]TQJ05576.1 MaoC dehydratase-like protein [Amycolatopsis cihanbeyliensis]
MRTELELAERRALALLDRQEHRELGPVRAVDAVAFARAAGETDLRLLDPARPDFLVHPMFLPSLLRGPAGAEAAEYRPDGMYRDEVPGTDGLDVRLMAGGQEVRFTAPVPADEPVRLTRRLVSVQRKGSTVFLLLTVEKTYTAGTRVLAEVTERFIVR